MVEPGSRIFISYARADATFASRLARDLAGAGLPVWIDQLHIVAGEPWDTSIQRALSDASALLLILSPASCASENVMDEVSFALSNGKRVLPALYLESTIPFRWARLQRIDLSRDYKTGLAELVKAFGQEHAGLEPVHSEPGQGPSTSNSDGITVQHIEGKNVIVATKVGDITFGKDS